MSITFKTIGFSAKYIPEILAGRKKATIRIMHAMNSQIHAGDTVFLMESSRKQPFALAEIASVEYKTFKEFREEDFSEAQVPETFAAFKEMMSHYYDALIDEDTVFGVIRFRIFDDGQDGHLAELLMQSQEAPEDPKTE